jgi:hypothetical protein
MNQVSGLTAYRRISGDSPDQRATTDTVIVGVQTRRFCWMGGISPDDSRFRQISFPSWQATRADSGRCVDAVLAAVRAAR